MGQLLPCLAKAGKNISREHRDAILARNSELISSGLPPRDAALKAIDERLAHVRALIAKAEPANDAKVELVAPTPAPAAGHRVIINTLGKDGLTDAERAAGKKPYSDAPAPAPAAAPKPDKAEIRPFRRADGSIGYEAVPIAAPSPASAPDSAALETTMTGAERENARLRAAHQAKMGMATMVPPVSAQKPPPSANTIFTEDAAAAARARLKAKLGRLNSGVDPEMLMDGITLAGYHVEKGARTFAAYARAMVDDLGEAVKPYLQSWYMAVRADPRAADFKADMDKASAVEDLDIDTVLAQSQNAAEEPDDGHATRELDQPGVSPLEGAPTEAVQGSGSGRETGGRPEAGRGEHEPRPGEPAQPGDSSGQRLGDGAGAVPVPARGSGRKPRGSAKQGVQGDGGVQRGDGSDPDAGRKGGVTPKAPNAAPIDPPAFKPQDFRIEDDLALGEGGQKTKYRGNVDAIRLLKELEVSGRKATPEEQRVLARYVGWGGLSQAFDPANADWKREHAELKALLTPEEYVAAEESTQYAHYTSREIVGGIYDALKHFGFTGGRVSEYGGGVGNFIGLMPEGLRTASRFTLVERDPIAAGIAAQLYPQQNIQQADFTEFVGNDNFFDASVGNPPFARTALTDKSGRKHLTGLSVHNYFFAKAVDMLREGGILAQVVSNSFLDAKRDNARRYIADRVEFLGAVRLPNNAFAKNAGTEVTTDIIFLRKLPDDQWGSRSGKENRDRWLEIETVPDPAGGEPVPVNKYFADNPEMMLGSLGRYGTMYGPDQPALRANPGQDTATLLKAAIARLPANVYTAPSVATTTRMNDQVIVALRNPTVQEGGHYLEGGKLYRRLQDQAGESRAVEITPKTPWSEKLALGDLGFKRLTALTEMRQTLRSLLAAELAGDKRMVQLRKQLNQQYDAYTAAHGLINDRVSTRVFDDDPDFPLLASLEHNYMPGVSALVAKKQGGTPTKSSATKAPIFTARVVEERKAPTRAESPSDALTISMAERGRIDTVYIGQLLGRDGDEVLKELADGDKPHLFLDPATNEYTLRDAYLSGNVRTKLDQARASGMLGNARALEEVQPPDVGAHEISLRLGSPWVPTQVYEDFAKHLFGEGTRATLAYVKANSSYSGVIHSGSEIAATNTWGTQDYSGPELLVSILNNRGIKVTYKDADGNLRVDPEATEKANLKATDIRQAFADWAFKDADRSDLLAKVYNETNNNYVTRAFDGSYMHFPGKVPDSIIQFRRHQRNAIARIVQDRTTLLDHVVGAGKTFTVVSAAMELKRTGLANKPLVIVPNHLVKQWASDFYRLYPSANVLTATKQDFEKANRRKFLAKIATGDWDAVVMAHSSFGFVRPAPEFEEQFNAEQVANIVATINSVEAGDGDATTKKRTVKQLAALKEKLENRIDALRQKPIDALLDFRQIGVDQLFVDEAHLFKNLMFSTKMQNVRGLGDAKGSQRAYDLFIKAHQLYAQNGRGQGVVFATGTPVSNSLAEMYHMMRFLMPRAMSEAGFESFDAWANTFASVEQVWMQKTSGDGFKADNRMSTFVNTPELLKMFDQVADTVTMDDIKKAYSEENNGREFPLPKLKTGRRQPVSLDKSAAQESYMQGIAARAKAIEGKRTNIKGSDNALTIMTDARKAAMDIRLVGPDVTQREPGGRIDRAAQEIASRYQQYAHVKGTQIVFSDLGTPIKHARAEMKEWEALQARINKGLDQETITAANFGNEAAMSLVEDAEDAQAELDAKGRDWLDAVKSALRGFSVYDDLKAALIERGIPEHEIAFIHDYNTDDQKANLFRKMNAGDMRVLIGSTPKLGAGTNVQERLVAEHHLDVPWKPSDVEQREGRIVRQGNRLINEVKDFEIEILAYVTKDTLDMRMWQVQETKLKMINQLRMRQIGREIDNAFEDMEMSAGEMQAAATGNIDLLREIQLRTDVKKLEQAKRSFDAQRNELQSRVKRAEAAVNTLPARVERAKQVGALAEAYVAEQRAHIAAFKATINGEEFTDAKLAGAKLSEFVDAKQFKKKGVDGAISPEQFAALPEAEREGWKEGPVPLSVDLNGTTYTSRATLGEAFADLRGDVNDPPLWNVDGKTFIRRSQAAAAIAQRVAEAVADQKAFPIGRIGGFEVAVEGQAPDALGNHFIDLTVTGAGQTLDTTVRAKTDDGEAGARYTALGAINSAIEMVRGARHQANWLAGDLERAQKTLAEAKSVKDVGEWPQQAKLDAARAAHREVLQRMAAKPKPADDASPDQSPPDAALSRGNLRGQTVTLDTLQQFAATMRQEGVRGLHVVQSVQNLPGLKKQMVLRSAPDGNVRGAYFRGDDSVYLVADHLHGADDIAFVLMHEAFHRGLARELGADAKRLLRQMYLTNPALAKAARAQMATHKIGLDEAIEEALADMAGEGKAKSLKGWDKLMGMIRAWLAKVGDALGIDIRWTDDMVETFVAGIRNVGLIGKAVHVMPADVGASASRVDGFAQAVAKALAQESRDNVQVSTTPAPVLRALGVGDKPVYTSTSVLRKMHFDHGLSQTAIARLPELLADPAMVFKSDTQTDRLVVIAQVPSANRPLAIAVEPNGTTGRTEVVFLPSAYLQDDPRRLERWIRAGLLKYANKERSRQLATTTGLQLPGVVQRAVGFSVEKYMTPADIEEPPAMLSRAPVMDTLRNLGGGYKTVGETTRQYTPEQIAAMRNVGFQVETPTLEQRVKAVWKDAGKKLAQGLVDQFAPVKDISKDAYGLLRLAKGASGAFEVLLQGGRLKLTDGAYDFDEANKGGVIDRLLKPLGGEHHDFFRWVAANRAEKLKGEGRERLFTDDDITALKSLADGTTQFDYTLKHGANAGRVTRDRTLIYPDALKTFNEFNQNVLDLAEESGLIDGESREIWESEFYVPFYRVADEEDGGVRGMNIKGGVVRQEAFKALKGGQQSLNADLLDNTLMNWAHLLDAAAKNRAAVATLSAAEQMGAAFSAPESVAREMANSVGKKSNVVWVKEGGMRRFYVVDDPYLMTALTSLEFAGMRGPVMKAMGAFKHALTIGVTASPFFKVRNLIRDSVQAIGTAPIGYNPVANVAQGWKLTDPKSDAYFRLLAGGGTIHFGTMMEGSEAKRVQALVESGVDAGTILGDEHKVKAFYRRYIEPAITAYNELGNRGEAITRAALYDQLVKQGASHAEASLQARDLMDFSMQGSFATVRFLTQVVPFFNARIQGLYKIGRAAKEDPRRIGVVLGAAALASIALAAIYGDDDDWKKREDWDRNNYWWFKFGGQAFRIPKPFEIGALATVAERGFELAFDKEMTGKRFNEQVVALISDNLSLNPIPQLVKPMLDIYANKDSFTGRPIETMGMERLKPEYRFNDRTSMVARGISTAANALTAPLGVESPSPLQVDHLLRGYFSWVGALVVGAADAIARPATGQPEQAAVDYWKTATGGMVSDLRDAPSRYVTQMYAQAKEIEQAYGTWRQLIKEGRVDEAREFRASNLRELVQYRQAEKIKKAESKFNERIRQIERSAATPDEKRDQIRQLQAHKDQIARALTPV